MFTLALAEERQRQLWQEILEHERIGIEKRRELNSYVPVVRLLPELLQMILTFYRDDVFREHDLVTNQWIRITHVCHRWREIAIQYPSLWTRVDAEDLRAFKIFSERSQSAPLYIDVDGLSMSVAHAEAVLAHASRIRHIFFCYVTPRAASLFYSCTAGVTISSLTSLRLHGARPDWPLHPEWQLLPPLHALPGLICPNLRTLEVFYLPLCWDHHLITTTLTELVVILSYSASQYHIQATDTLRMLMRMPQLELAEFTYVHAPSTSSSTIISHRDVVMPRLKTLRLAEDTSVLIHILSHLAIPSTAKLEITSNMEDLGTMPSSNILLAQLLTLVVKQPAEESQVSRKVATACIDIPGDLTVCFFLFWSSCVDITSGEANHPLFEPPDDFSDPDLKWAVGTQHVSDELFRSLPLHDVRNLYLCDPSSSGEDWRNMFAHMQAVESLHVEYDGQPHLAQVLSLYGAQFQDPSKALFPKLRQLHLRLLSGVQWPDSRPQENLSKLLHELSRALKSRRAAGIGLTELRMQSDMSAKASEVQELRSHVDTLIWPAPPVFGDNIDGDSESEDDWE